MSNQEGKEAVAPAAADGKPEATTTKRKPRRRQAKHDPSKDKRKEMMHHWKMRVGKDDDAALATATGRPGDMRDMHPSHGAPYSLPPHAMGPGGQSHGYVDYPPPPPLDMRGARFDTSHLDVRPPGPPAHQHAPGSAGLPPASSINVYTGQDQAYRSSDVPPLPVAQPVPIRQDVAGLPDSARAHHPGDNLGLPPQQRGNTNTQPVYWSATDDFHYPSRQAERIQAVEGSPMTSPMSSRPQSREPSPLPSPRASPYHKAYNRHRAERSMQYKGDWDNPSTIAGRSATTTFPSSFAIATALESHASQHQPHPGGGGQRRMTGPVTPSYHPGGIVNSGSRQLYYPSQSAPPSVQTSPVATRRMNNMGPGGNPYPLSAGPSGGVSGGQDGALAPLRRQSDIGMSAQTSYTSYPPSHSTVHSDTSMGHGTSNTGWLSQSQPSIHNSTVSSGPRGNYSQSIGPGAPIDSAGSYPPGHSQTMSGVGGPPYLLAQQDNQQLPPLPNSGPPSYRDPSQARSSHEYP